MLTRYAAQESERGRVARIMIDHSFGGGLWQRQCQRDGFVELPSPRLDGDDRRNGHSVAQQLRRQLRRDRLGLSKTKHNRLDTRVRIDTRRNYRNRSGFAVTCGQHVQPFCLETITIFFSDVPSTAGREIVGR